MAAEGTSMHAYVVVSLPQVHASEEPRVNSSHLDLEGDASGSPLTPPSIQLWRSVRVGRDKDEAIPTNLGAAGALRRRAPRTPTTPACPADSDRAAVG